MTTRIRQVLRPVFPSQPIATNKPVLKARSTPAVPFFRDPGHRIPTKWGLYRPLLRLTSSPSLVSTNREIKSRWKEKKGLTSVPKVRSFLAEFYELLEHLCSDQLDQQKKVEILERRLKEKHNQIDSTKAEKAKKLKEKLEEEKNRKSKLTGAYHRPTIYNIPLPRLKPQPKSIGSMIHNRLRARERRIAKRREYSGLLVDMKLEVGFWKSLQASPNSTSSLEKKDDGVGVRVEINDDWNQSKDPRSPGGWDGIIKNEIKIMDERFNKENKRSELVFDNALMDRISEAKETKRKWWKSVQEQNKMEKGKNTENNG